MMGNGTTYLCVIATGGIPFQIPINPNTTMSLPRACKMARVPLQCKASSPPAAAPGPAGTGAPSASPTSAPSPSPSPKALEAMIPPVQEMKPPPSRPIPVFWPPNLPKVPPPSPLPSPSMPKDLVLPLPPNMDDIPVMNSTRHDHSVTIQSPDLKIPCKEGYLTSFGGDNKKILLSARFFLLITMTIIYFQISLKRISWFLAVIFHKHRNSGLRVKCMSEEGKNDQTSSALSDTAATPKPTPPPVAKPITKFGDVFAFSGPASERINGR
ncbi:hypothetical protein K7X08_032724 [Anisodus acutangulus]|uniref:Uncharacterized protein n=1 Tax=Anisodus acutangulus TaxID=402998 RepID=A0A9Q1RCM0_9SOLA|nr:hypothetical protein K7X08_032724 [Anisodus acutangulus]